MAVIIPVPTLSTQGFVTDMAGKLDTLLAHFFLSDYNETHLYPGGVASLPALIQKGGGDAQICIGLIQDALTAYLNAYYVSSQVKVTTKTPLDTDASIKVELIIVISVRDGDSVGSFKRLVVTNNSKLSEIIKLNNG